MASRPPGAHHKPVKGGPSTEKERKCMKCSKKFLSTWNGNWRCKNCLEQSARDATPEEQYTLADRIW